MAKGYNWEYRSNRLSNDGSEVQTYADRHGLRRENLDFLMFVLRGMRGDDFCMAFQVRMADELLALLTSVWPICPSVPASI